MLYAFFNAVRQGTEKVFGVVNFMRDVPAVAVERFAISASQGIRRALRGGQFP